MVQYKLLNCLTKGIITGKVLKAKTVYVRKTEQTLET
jgi:hypothetical protein